jgi:two-component system, OmpR family, phosphate regulon sensor histidine kinase PhoR
MLDENLDTQQAYAQARAFGKDLARLYALEKEQRRALETTNQKLRAIFDTAPNGLAVVDSNLNILEANPYFLALFEQTNECEGCSLSTFIPTDSLLDIMQTIETGSQKSGRIDIEVKQPVFRSMVINVSHLSNSQDWVLVFHDLSEQRRLEGLKNEFVNIAAHELRTPLAGVMGFVSVLREDLKNSDNPVAHEIMDLILQSTERLKGIIDELVDFATTHRITEESLSLSHLDLGRLFQKSFQILQPQLEAKNIMVQYEFANEPLMILGDQLILSEVIYHLVENAVKFNRVDGQIVIRGRFIPSTTGASAKNGVEAVFIEIEDTGIGIPQTELNRIFDKFYQVEEHLIRTVGGLGLGLNIARHGVQRHGGHLSVTSQLGQGSTFRVILPMITQTSDVSIDKRPDVAYQQMLAYAKDMAHAIIAQRKLSNKIQQVQTLSTQLTTELNQLASNDANTEAYCAALCQAQKIAQELTQLSE